MRIQLTSISHIAVFRRKILCFQKISQNTLIHEIAVRNNLLLLWIWRNSRYQRCCDSCATVLPYSISWTWQRKIRRIFRLFWIGQRHPIEIVAAIEIVARAGLSKDYGLPSLTRVTCYTVPFGIHRTRLSCVLKLLKSIFDVFVKKLVGCVGGVASG